MQSPNSYEESVKLGLNALNVSWSVWHRDMESRHQSDPKKAEAAGWSKSPVPRRHLAGARPWWTSVGRSWPAGPVSALLLRPGRLSWLASAATETQPSAENKAGLEFGAAVSTPCITQGEHRAHGASVRQQNQVLKARRPAGGCSAWACLAAFVPASSVHLPWGGQQPQRGQELQPTLRSERLGQPCSARLLLVSAHAVLVYACAAAYAYTQFCIMHVFTHIFGSALSPSNSPTRMAPWSATWRWLPPSKVSSTSAAVMYAEEQPHQPWPKAFFTAPFLLKSSWSKNLAPREWVTSKSLCGSF